MKVDPLAHAVPLPKDMNTMGGYIQEDSTIKIVLITFGVGLLVGSAVLLIVVSLWRVYLKSKKATEIQASSLGNPRASCNIGDTLYKAKRCAYIVMGFDDSGTFHAHGSGISLGRGYIVTNRHVTQGSTVFKTRINGVEKPLALIQSSTENDVSLLKSDASLPQCPFFDSGEIAVGEELYALGWPKERDQIDPAITKGIYSRTNTQSDGVKYVQTDAAINPGNSGGPLVNECGIVAMNTAKFSWFNKETPTEGLSLALPAKRVLDIVAELQKDQ